MDEQELKKETTTLSTIATMLFCFGIAILLTLLVASKANADELLYSQTTDNSGMGSSGSNQGGVWDISEDGTPPDWYVTGVGMYIDDYGSGTGATWKMQITDSAGNTYIADEGDEPIRTFYPTTDSWYEFTFSTPVQILQPVVTNDVRFELVVETGAGGTNTIQIGIGNTDVYAIDGRTGTSIVDNSDPTMYILGFNGDGTPLIASTTRIISQNTPTNGQITGSDVVTFDFDYFYNDVTHPNLSIAGVEIRDFTAGIEYIPLEEPILASGESNFSELANLESGHLHGWRPYLRNNNGTEKIVGSWISFEVESVSAPWDPLEGDLASSSTSTILARFFNYDSKLAQKWPFAYIYDISSAIQNAPNASTTFPTLTLATASSSALNISAEIFSEDKVDTFVPENMRLFFRGLIAVALWLAFINMVWFTVRHQF